ncbi:MAG: hypothetical protein ACTSU7_01635 [Candidatus Heimdallarchaeaceae archaeon]
MKTVTIPKEDWESLLDELNWPSYRDLVISCNRREVWLKTKASYHHPHERTHQETLAKYPFIEEIHKEVIQHERRGARHVITKNKVYLSKNDKEICKIKMT